jgi:hypothetical protein
METAASFEARFAPSSYPTPSPLARVVRRPPRETGGGRGRMDEQSYDPICTCEGGEPQSFRKERPRHPLEGRGEQGDASVEGNIARLRTRGTMSTQIDRLTELAKEDPKRQFYSIAHMITFGALYAAFRGLRKKASAGVDGVTYEEYERDVAGNLQTLHERLKNGKYQAQPLRRVYISKENGKQRPISIPALEDKIVQKATVEILNAIYEQDFLDCSYGFRPGRGQHQALDEVGRVICTRPTGWILEIDVTAYLDPSPQCPLIHEIAPVDRLLL